MCFVIWQPLSVTKVACRASREDAARSVLAEETAGAQRALPARWATPLPPPGLGNAG